MEKETDFRGYKERFRGIVSYCLYTKWIQKTSVVGESKTHIEIDTGKLKEYQVRFLYENHQDDLEDIFGKKVKLKGKKL